MLWLLACWCSVVRFCFVLDGYFSLFIVDGMLSIGVLIVFVDSIFSFYGFYC